MRVIKKDGSRVPFDRSKVLTGIYRACEKRPVTKQQIEETVDRIERQCHDAFDKEVQSSMIGNLVMSELRKLDQVAYVRFASVYREFKDVTQFMEELRPMIERKQTEG